MRARSLPQQFAAITVPHQALARLLFAARNIPVLPDIRGVGELYSYGQV